jgi:hypothetical protein
METKKYRVTVLILICVSILNVAALIINIAGLNIFGGEPRLQALIEKSETEVTEDTEDPRLMFYDREYKLFFGEWKVEKIIGQHYEPSCTMEAAEEIIGKRISYSVDSIKNDGIEVVKMPVYNYHILPVSPDKSYVEKMPTLQEIGISGNYFVYVYADYSIIDQGFDAIGNEFYIKDDTTLIMLEWDYYYELKRVSYVDNILQVHP